MRHIQELVPCLRASVAVFDFMANKARLIATHTKTKTQLDAGAKLSLEAFGEMIGASEADKKRIAKI